MNTYTRKQLETRASARELKYTVLMVELAMFALLLTAEVLKFG